jgi:hypothetical protein
MEMLLAIMIIAIMRKLSDPLWWETRYRRQAERESAALLTRLQTWRREQATER